MTDTLRRPDDALLAPPTGLPPVERRAAIPHGFLAGGATVGIKASGRPDLAVITTLRGPDGPIPAAAAAVFTPNTLAAAPVRLSRANLAATAPEGEGRWGWATGVVSTSGSANAATGAAGEADQRAILAGLAAASVRRRPTALAMSTGIIGTRLPLDLVLPGIDRIVAGGLTATDAGLEAAAVALRTTDSRTKVVTTTVELPAAAGGSVTVRVSGHGQGRGHDPSPDGDDAQRPADRRHDRPGDAERPAPAGRRADLEPALDRRRHEHERHGHPPRQRRGRRRADRRGVAPRLPRWAPRSRRSPATWPASRRPTARAPRRS